MIFHREAVPVGRESVPFVRQRLKPATEKIERHSRGLQTRQKIESPTMAGVGGEIAGDPGEIARFLRPGREQLVVTAVHVPGKGAVGLDNFCSAQPAVLRENSAEMGNAFFNPPKTRIGWLLHDAPN